jgi:hypothetical protein
VPKGEETGVVNSVVVGEAVIESVPVCSDDLEGVAGVSAVSITLNELLVDLAGVTAADNVIFTGVFVAVVAPVRAGVLGADWIVMGAETSFSLAAISVTGVRGGLGVLGKAISGRGDGNLTSNAGAVVPIHRGGRVGGSVVLRLADLGGRAGAVAAPAISCGSRGPRSGFNAAARDAGWIDLPGRGGSLGAKSISGRLGEKLGGTSGKWTSVWDEP